MFIYSICGGGGCYLEKFSSRMFIYMWCGGCYYPLCNFILESVRATKTGDHYLFNPEFNRELFVGVHAAYTGPKKVFLPKSGGNNTVCTES